jgi:D-aminopeptidase
VVVGEEEWVMDSGFVEVLMAAAVVVLAMIQHVEVVVEVVLGGFRQVGVAEEGRLSCSAVVIVGYHDRLDAE